MRRESILLLSSIALSLIAIEVALRLFAKDVVPLYVPDEELGYVYWKNFETVRYNNESGQQVKIRTNSRGFVDDEWVPQDQAFKIMVLGDSLVESLQLNRGQRFTDLLQKKFLEKNQKVQIFNVGKGGLGPESYIIFLKKFFPVLKPDLVIVGLYNGNDFENVNYNTAPNLKRLNYLVKNGQIIPYREIASRKEKISWGIKNTLGKFYTTQFVYKFYLRLKNQDAPSAFRDENGESTAVRQSPLYCRVNDRDRLDSFLITKKIFQEMKNLIGEKLIILQIPDKQQFSAESREECDYLLPEKFMSELGREQGVRLIQLFPLMQSNYENYYWSHLSSTGHAFVSETLFDYLNENLFF